MRGTELKQIVDTAVRKVQDEAAWATAEVRHAGGRINELARERAKRAEELARIVLDNLGGTTGEDNTLTHLRQAMTAKAREHERLGLEEQTLRQRLGGCQMSLAQAQEASVAADEARNDLEEKAEARMLENEEFAQAKEQRDETFEQMKRAKEKLRTAQEDVRKKVPHYLSDPFFSYLLDRRYGEKEYQAGAITRALDGWVARLVQFQRYYPDFQRLKAIPEKIMDHIQWLEQRHGELSRHLEYEHQRILKEQTPEYEKAVQNFLAARVNEETLESELLDLEEKLQSLNEAMTRLERGTDPNTQQAIALIKEVVLGGEKGRARNLVEASDTTQDDALLVQIRALEENIEHAQEQLKEAEQAYDKAREKLAEAENFHRKFQHSGMGRANRRHPSLRKDDVMGAVLAGHGLASLLRRMESQVRVISSSPSYPSTSSSSSSSWPSSRSSSGRAFGGGSGRTGGGFGGGRGRTGGGF